MRIPCNHTYKLPVNQSTKNPAFTSPFQRSPDAFRHHRNFIEVCTACIQDCIPHGWCNPIHRDLSNGFDSEGMGWFKGFNKDRLQLRHFMSRKYMIVSEIEF